MRKQTHFNFQVEVGLSMVLSNTEQLCIVFPIINDTIYVEQMKYR